MHAKRPAIVALTETHLPYHRPEIKIRLQQMLPGYIVSASCHPGSTAVRWTRRGPQMPRPAKSHAHARANMLLAVHADWAQGRHVRQHQPPATLQG